MHFTKPAWVAHYDPASLVKSKDDSGSDEVLPTKRLSIFSVHVHPDGSRIATGGLDTRVRIWSTKPILNPASEASGRPPKSLCTLSMHTGPVLVVRWAYSGKWLASGSDDAVVMIWEYDPNAGGRVWGSDEVNIEGWKPLKRLPGHESDVTDVAWSPGDRYLASVGLDSTVLIWSGYSLERLQVLSLHQGFVKGVCWDPVGEFLATQSDDRSVKIWRTSDWGLEAEVTKPFEDSPGSTFFRRLSWSPDGAHITASNATNNKGFVFIAAVIARNTWTSEISLVGHENTVEVAAYNPHIFLRNPSQSPTTSNICSVVALGADDRSVSVWQTKSARPLIVAKEVFERQIMDLSWSYDGLTLYAASSDGTIGVFAFDAEELEGIAPHSVQERYLQKFGFVPPPLPSGYSHSGKDEPISTASPVKPEAPTSSLHDSGGERVNVLVAKKKKKGPNGTKVAEPDKDRKRVPLMQGGANGGMGAPASASGAAAPHSRLGGPPFGDLRTPSHSHLAAPNHFPTPDEQPAGTWSRRADLDLPRGTEASQRRPSAHFADDDVSMPFAGVDDHLDSVDGGSTWATASDEVGAKGSKRKAGTDVDDRPTKARTLGGDVVRGAPPPGSVRALEATPGGRATGGGFGTTVANNAGGATLVPPLLMSYLSTNVEGGGSDEVFEARNSEGEAPNEIAMLSGKSTQWLDYLPSPALAVRATSSFCVVAMQNGSVNVYSSTGRRLMPTMYLGSPCFKMDVTKHALAIITCSGQLFSWNTKKQLSFFPPTSILPLLATPNCTISDLSVRPNGTPVATCNGSAFAFDPALGAWAHIGDRWWASGSDAWQGRQRTAAAQSRPVVATIESAVAAAADEDGGASAFAGGRSTIPAWWSVALTLGHLETRVHAARMLESPQELRQAVLAYAKRIADEAFRAKAEELIRELFGPVYWRPGREDSWVPTLAGLPKRELLRDVLSVFVRSKTLTKLAMDWQETLKKAAADEWA
ncbi:hypothetical protein HGRIS_000265 [Hohenbuehelia grisea]|uniref:Protein HIR n=1 Tax=Hohenbuehelia grisea TaxID=104357 RepID=A0ABR3JSI4_9AGAR